MCGEEGKKFNIDINAALYCAVRMYMCMCVKKKHVKKEKKIGDYRCMRFVICLMKKGSGFQKLKGGRGRGVVWKLKAGGCV